MKGGSWLLAAAAAALWTVVYLATQVLTRPALPTGWTVLVGVILSTVLTLGYPSPLRGPRSLRRPGRPPLTQRRAAKGAGESVSTFAAVGRNMALRSGLTAETADRTVRLLRPLLGGDAVAITDREKVLAFAGPGKEHHLPGAPLGPGGIAKAMTGERTQILKNRREIGCQSASCPLESGIAVPLAIGGRTVGSLEVYRVEGAPPPRDLVEGMAGILSLHLELADLDRERQLAADAKLDALRAQINPHFLFNTLNTIASKARTDPEEARQLLLRLSDFFRYSIRQDGHFADFGQEYFFVRTYLSLEQARYAERLRVRYDVDPQVLGVQVPVLVIQPLVENAVKHGLAPKVGGGTVVLKARVDPLARATIINVRDDGVGIPPEVLAQALKGGGYEGGIGLRNISERLTTLFGERYQLDVRSRPDEGTTVDLRIPLR
ncbi:MAG TPA: histidine kinase [Egibacteraceae bacterium]|nr:histidine kinase [Egibacteraceae bacterium]